jgi:putative ABC transport system permease protein
MLGLVGGGMGTLLGWLGAQAAVRVVGQTVNALYHATSVRSAHPEPLEIAGALVLSVVSSVAAGWGPARAAAATPPAQLLGRGRAATPRPPARWTAPAALALAVVGALLCLLPPVRFEGGGRLSLAAFAAALGWLLAAGFAAGLVPPTIARALDGPRPPGPSALTRRWYTRGGPPQQPSRRRTRRICALVEGPISAEAVATATAPAIMRRRNIRF